MSYPLGVLADGYSPLPRDRFFAVWEHIDRGYVSSSKNSMLAEVDMSSACRLRERLATASDTKPSYAALMVRAVSLAVRRHPYVNRVPIASPLGTKVVQLNDVDVGIAVERDEPGKESLAYAALLRQTDRKSLVAITHELRRLSLDPDADQRWRLFRWLVEKLPTWLACWVIGFPRRSAKLWIQHRGGAVYISSPSKYGVDAMVGIWPWPIALSFGLVKKRPMVVDDQIVARPSMVVTLSFDRRLLGGAPAARFLATVCALLENAETELDSDAEKSGS